MSFLPENFEAPKGESKYLKLKIGQTKFLPLDSAIVGYIAWSESKPIRRKTLKEIESENYDKFDKSGKPQNPKYFIAFPVWDYESQSVKIIEITQNSIINAINNFYLDSEWGDPVMNYSFTIEGTGEGIERRYSVRANPPRPIETKIAEEFAENPVNLDALFDGEDPFAA